MINHEFTISHKHDATLHLVVTFRSTLEMCEFRAQFVPIKKNTGQLPPNVLPMKIELSCNQFDDFLPQCFVLPTTQISQTDEHRTRTCDEVTRNTWHVKDETVGWGEPIDT
jgi:hypothetical protein